MSIDVSLVTDREEWNDLVKQSPCGTPFHRAEALEVMNNYSGTLYPYAGYKGQEPVGLFPVFSETKGPARVAYSPPRGLRINYLGPILLNQDHLKERKAIKRHRRFITAVDEDLRKRIDPEYIYVQTGTEYADPRPFLWNEYASRKPFFTYVTDITPPEDDLIMSFSSDLRQNIRNTPEDSYEVTETDGAEIRNIIGMLEDRHSEFSTPKSFFRDLYRALPDDVMRVYGCYADGEFIGGQISLEGNGTLLTWQGVGNREHDVPVMDVLLWNVIRRARDRGLEQVDHGGANYRNLSDYKSKFEPEVKVYYRLSWSSPLARAYGGIMRNVVERFSS